MGFENPDLISTILEHFDRLSNQTYERQRISAVIGVTNVERDSGVTLADVWSEEFAKVLTSGIESMLAVDAQGRVYAHLVPDRKANHVSSPNFLRYLCEWTTDKQICVALNRNGEILILKNKRLEFARRRGSWLHFAHDSILEQIAKRCTIPVQKSRMLVEGVIRQTDLDLGYTRKPNVSLANLIHETCLDVSFARSGGCIAVIDKAKRDVFDDKGLVADEDLLGRSDKPKTKALHWLTTKGKINTRARFIDLDRRLRQELAGTDGATVIDSEGFLIAVGAIVRVPPGSASGARRAAARALAEFGMGIKISADGDVSGFLKDKTDRLGNVKENCIFRYG